MYELVIKGGKIFHRRRFVELDIGIIDGRIERIGRNIGRATEIYNAAGMLVLPGIIDGHVHFRDPGETSKEDFTSGSRAAAAGGVTTIIDMPNNIVPITTPKLFAEKLEIARAKSVVNFALYAAVPDDLSFLAPLQQAGAIAFGELFLDSYSGDLLALKREISRLNALLAIHAEEKEVIRASLAGARRPAEYVAGRPPQAEIDAIRRSLAGDQCRILFVHLTTAHGVALAAGRAAIEVTPHHLLLSQEEMEFTDFRAVMNPPLRRQSDCIALWESLVAGKITTIGSDHAPHLATEKLAQSVEAGRPGIPGIETMVPLILTAATKQKIPLERVISAMTDQPAALFKLSGRGAVEVGNFADITVVDPYAEQIISGERFHSQAKLTPFEGRKVSYLPTATFVNGKLVYCGGEIITDQPCGRFITPGI
ncbi:dihydroorotase family protein [Candidatus Acetothermia bacterium]|nr:dihydroorotase family protein [Candidatus Acetothermia bacterium]MCI2426969.1 dihydroorotase family protein [Candidatus Acetothermia bacterium]MCI2428537.1 dihydroorotase family protein [Candidatus Acetothermia bacterium]